MLKLIFCAVKSVVTKEKGDIMSRKGENIRKRKDGRWEARYIKGRKPDGSIQYGYVYAGKYLDVKQKRNDVLRNFEIADSCEIISITFNKLFNEWKKEVRPKVKESSYFFYETIIEHHLRPFWGGMLLDQLSSARIQAFILSKTETNIASSYLHSILILFQSALKLAQRREYINTPIPFYQLPKSRKNTPDIFTLKEWKHLEEYLRKQEDDFSFGILLCMYTGIRVGELSGLMWGDYDPESEQILIRRTIYRIKNADYDGVHNKSKTILCMESPKTASSIRDIPLPNFLVIEVQKRKGNKDDFILTGTERFMEPRNIQKRYKRILEKCKLRYLNFHSLRHSFATIGIQRGFDHKTMAEILGHASVNTTLNIYVHSNLERKKECMELLS